MKVASLVWLLVAALTGAFAVDFVQRLASPDFVAVSFSEGGDDAYYFFTVPRNIAQGHGITIDGTHWTTGFQPLWGLVCALAFLAPSDRAAMAIIYVLSIALWVAGALLFVRLVRRASLTPLSSSAAALLVVLFLGEAQLTRSYFNGMETGLYLTSVLWLLAAFQDYLGLEPHRVDLRRVVNLGVLAGLTMLARNDGLFLCGTLLTATLFLGRRRHPVRDVAVVVAVASAMVVPWLAFCQWASGNPMPQSGIATSIGVRGYVPLMSIARKIVLSIDPLGFLKMRTLADDHLAVAAVLTLLVAALLVLRWRRARPVLVPPSGLILLSLAGAVLCLLLYYPLASAAGQFFERYFTPLKLLVLLLLALLIVRGLAKIEGAKIGGARIGGRPLAGALILAVAAATVGSNLYWTARDYGRPWRSHLGLEVYEIVRSPYATGTSRIGMAESGRLGFLYPTRVVNLDGKMNVEALHALLAGRLGSYIQSANLDYIMLHDDDVEYFDRTIADWRKHWRSHGMLGEFEVFEKAS
jgi:hypothetical protein